MTNALMLAFSAATATACAAGAPHLDAAACPVSMAPVAQLGRSTVTAPALPTADRLPDRFRDRLGDAAQIQVDLCVAPDGSVASVGLVRGTELAMFDRAVLHDIAGWKFAAGTTASCKRTTVVYRPARV